MPGMSGIRGTTPVASTTSSYPASSSNSCAGVESHLHPVLVEHSRVVADGLAELFLAGNPSGHVELATDHVATLEQRDIVAALRCGHRGGQPGRAGADHRDAPGAARRRQHQVGLTAGTRVEQTRHLLVHERMIKARLVARDARVDLVGRIGLRLVHPVRVGQQRARHRDQLHVRVGQDLLGGLRHVDAVRRDNWDIDVFGDRAADIDERAVRHGGDDRRNPRLVPAEPRVDHRRACRLDFGCQRDDLVPALAVLHVVGHGHPVADDEVRPNSGAAATHDLDREPSPLRRRTTPRIGSLVGARREELVEQIAFAAHDLDTVVAGVAGQLRAAGEVADGAFDIAQRARPERVDRRLDRRRTHRKRMVGIASRMQDLQQDLAAFVMHRVGDGAMAADVRRRRHLRRERK